MEIRRVESALFETLVRTVGGPFRIIKDDNTWTGNVFGVLYRPTTIDAADTFGSVYFKLLLRKSDLPPILLNSDLHNFVFIEEDTGRNFSPVSTDGRWFLPEGNSGVVVSITIVLNDEPIN